MRAKKQADKAIYDTLLSELDDLRQDLLKLENSSDAVLNAVHPHHRDSAANLIHYLGLRRKDIRPLQHRLSHLGLSSLGRTESHVLPTLNAMTTLLRHVMGKSEKPAAQHLPDGKSLLEDNTNRLLGKPPAERRVRVMVTLNGEDAHDYPVLKKMLNHGMDCARINCAHDHPEIWKAMVENIRRAQRETGKHCRILMDLCGPKLRTGPVGAGPAAQKWRPERDIYGNVIVPAVIWIHPEQSPGVLPAHAQVSLPVAGDWLAKAAVNDVIEFTDARGAQRRLKLLSQVGKGFLAESAQTAYLKPGLELNLVRTASSGKPRKMDATGKVAGLPPTPAVIRLKAGDSLILTREQAPGQAAQYDAKGGLVRPAVMACTLPGVFSSVKKGERILIDDGRIGGVIQSASSDELLVEITQARETGEKLLADKGINLPDTRFDMAGLTGQDIEHLDFVVRHADMVGLSFARKAADVEALQAQLKRLGVEDMGVVLKVENRMAFERLPELLFTLLKSPVVGVMIARGDLAVECGYERLAELQEEILWVAEAAHLPVIWATQVLEGLAKSGKPSRAEITDAAMGERAECVMLNKGPHILDAIQALNDILQRMQGHQMKKSALLRRLHW